MQFWRGLGLLAFSWVILSGSPVRADTAACDVTEAALKHVVGLQADRSLELQTTVSDFHGPYLSTDFIRQNFPGDDPDDQPFRWFVIGVDGATAVAVPPPSKQLAQAFLEQEPASATACSSVLEYARATNITVQTRATGRPQRKANGLYDRTFIALTKAVVSPDGTEALTYVSMVSGPLAGGGYLLLFRRDGSGAWVFAGQLDLWVS